MIPSLPQLHTQIMLYYHIIFSLFVFNIKFIFLFFIIIYYLFLKFYLFSFSLWPFSCFFNIYSFIYMYLSLYQSYFFFIFLITIKNQLTDSWMDGQTERPMDRLKHLVNFWMIEKYTKMLVIKYVNVMNNYKCFWFFASILYVNKS